MILSKLLLTSLFAFVGVQSFAKLTEPMGKSVSETVPELQGIGIDQKIGSFIPLDLEFKNENGQVVKLGQFLSPGKPMILSPVYYSCRTLCNYHLNGLTEGFQGLDWNIGEKFEVVAVSFDDHEGPELASAKKAGFLKIYNRAKAEKGWHFLTGNTASIKALTAAVGFNYRWNEAANEWAHPSSAIVISPEGQITRYLPGVYFRPQDIKLALNESTQGKLGTFVDRMVLFCFRYDEHQSKYSPFVSNIMKLGGGLMILVLAIWLIPFWLRSRRQVA